jgi:hypothetical protein
MYHVAGCDVLFMIVSILSCWQYLELSKPYVLVFFFFQSVSVP